MTVEVQEDNQTRENTQENINSKRNEANKKHLDIFITVKLFGEIFSRYLAQDD